MTWRCAAALLCLSLSLGACGLPAEEVEPAAAVAEEIEIREVADSELGSLFLRTRYAFHDHQGVVRGGDANAGAELTAAGVRVTPYHWPAHSSAPIRGATLRLETRSIGRGGLAVGSVGAGVGIASDGTGEIYRAGVTEVVRNVPRGIEQSWRFEAPPPGEGDLEVRVAVYGQSLGATTASGLHFVDTSTGIGFAYSNATWIDARGQRHSLPSRFEHGEIVLRVPADVVQQSTFPAVLDPTVSAEFGYDNPVYGPAGGGQYQPDIAYSGIVGAEYLVVWSDYRRSDSYSSDIFAARITETGSVVDQVGIQVLAPNVLDDQVEPAVTWVPDPDGAGSVQGHWYIVWTDRIACGGMIRGRRMRDDGSFSAPDFDVSDRGCAVVEAEPDVAFNTLSGGISGRVIILWRNTSNGGVQARICEVVDPSAGCFSGHTDISTQSSARAPAVAPGDNSTGFFVVWEDSRTGNWDVYGRAVTAGDTHPLALGNERTLTSHAAAQVNAAVAASPGGGLVAVWEDYRGAGITAEIYAQKIDSTGGLVGGNVGVSTASGNQLTPALVGGATNKWFVIWTDTRARGNLDIYGARLSYSNAAFQLHDPSGILISAAGGSQQTPVVAANATGSQYIGTWNDARSSSVNPDIYGARVRSSDGALLDANGFVISTASNQQESPAIATCGGKYLVAWTDTRNSFDNADIYGAITDSNSPPNILVNNIAISTASGRQDVPDVACDGTNFFVVWTDQRNGLKDIYGARVRISDGAVLDAGGIQISGQSATETDPAIAYQGCTGVFEVTWADNRSGNYDVFGKRVSTSGVVDNSSEVNVSGTVTGDQLRPDITWDNNGSCSAEIRFLIVWQDGRLGSGDFPDWNIWGRYHDLNGSLSSSIQITSSTSSQLAPSVATRPNAGLFTNRYHFVVYETYGSSDDISGTIVNPNGSLGGTLSIAATTSSEVEPDVATRSGDLLVVSYRTAATSERFDFGVLGQDIDLSPLSLVGSAFTISSQTKVRERAPAIKCASSTNCEVAYRVYVDRIHESSDPPPPVTDPSVGADRVRGRMLSY